MRTPPYVESPVARRAGAVPDMAPGRDHGSCRRTYHRVLPRRRRLAGVWPGRRSGAKDRMPRFRVPQNSDMQRDGRVSAIGVTRLKAPHLLNERTRLLNDSRQRCHAGPRPGHTVH